jgi:hypothetical protein
MYEVAESKIRDGLSRGTCLLLGAVATLLGSAMLLMAPNSGSPTDYVAIGIFCVIIALACFTSGRAREFVGGVLASAILGLAIWYLCAQTSGGFIISGRRSEPSLLNAIFYLVAFGVPSAKYIYEVRFGFARY